MKAKFFALLAVVLAVVSCQKDVDNLDVNMGGGQLVDITISLPEATRASSGVGALDNEVLANYDLRYILEIYRVEGTEIQYDSCQRFVENSTQKQIVFPVRLVAGRDYKIVAWADIVDKGSKEDRYYYTQDGLDNILLIDNGTVNWNAMDETRDAYTAEDLIENFSSASVLNLNLTRPFAKVRVIATDIVDVLEVGIKPTTATVQYIDTMPKKYNAVADGGKTSKESAKSHSYEYGKTATVYTDNDGEMTLFADYVFVPQSGTAKFSLEVFDAQGRSIKNNAFNTEIFVERNKVTTIKGDVLTTGGNVIVKIEDDFTGEIEIKVVDTPEALQEVINEIPAGGSANIELGGNIDLDDLLNAGVLSTTRAEKEYGLLISTGKEVVLDLNGYTISQTKECTANYSMIVNKGALTITDSSKNGTGKISFKDTGAGDPNFGWGSYTLRNEGTLVVDNGTIEHLGEQNPGNGQPNVHMYCAIFQYSGKSTINGGVISTPTYRSARLWNGEMTINGGQFVGQLWLQAVSDNANLVINGGEFTACGNDGSSVFVSNSGKTVKCSINGGLFNNKVGMSEPIACITGGTFTTAAKEATSKNLLANGYVFVEGENGTYTVENVGHYTDAEGNYYITNAKGLKWFAENVNTMEFYVSGSANIFDNKTVYLANDIDLDGAEWRPIGDYAFSRTSFNGVFDGQGYTVSNFKVTEPVRWTEKVTEASYGFFGNVKGTIKNLTIKNATVNPEGGRYSAALVGRLHNGGCIENCHVENSSVTILHWQVGGLVGQNNNGNISDCSVVGSTITGKAAVGAIVGMDMTAGEHTIENCRVANTALVQNESFGASYDASYGLAVGLVNASGIVLNIDNVVAEKNTIKGVADNTLVGDIETGATVTINGVSIATTAKQLQAALAEGKNVVLSSDLTIEVDEMMTAPYGNKMALSQEGGIFDGDGKSIGVTANGDNYVVMTNGGTIKNLDIDRGFRGIVLMYPNQDVYVDNVNIGVNDEVCYTINTAEGDGTHSLYVSKSVLNGWCSIGTAVKYVSFTDCSFGQGTYYTDVYGRLVKPYVDALFENCDFCNKCYIDLSAFVGEKVILKNCTVNGVKITAENWTSLVAPENTCGEGQISIELKNGTYMTAENVADYIVFE